jgi:hypothetical protein
MSCKYVSTNVESGDYERGCKNEGDGVHEFCGEHENLVERRLVAHGGNERAVARFRSGLSASEAIWADDADLAADLKSASDLLLPKHSVAK